MSGRSTCDAGRPRRARHGFILHPDSFEQESCGAQERTRTFTAVKPLAPEASASTNSTTWALGRLIRIGRTLVKYLQRLANTLYSEVALAYRDSAKYVR